MRSFSASQWYGFLINLPDNFQGFVKFSNQDNEIDALFAVNPQEAENSDAKVSEIETTDPVPYAFTLFQEDDKTPVPDAQVWVSRDEEGNASITETLITNADGVVTFMLRPGIYYLWISHATINFQNPTRLTVIR